MAFISDDFLLHGETARHLFHQYAAAQPILDYHCHLSPRDIADNRRFANLSEIWLEGDHYKWRAMRANGVAERYCTGDASAYEKFLAWSQTVPYTLRNPLYHWTHLELLRYFDIGDLLNEQTAPAIWTHANVKLADDDFTTHDILRRFGVKAICTTDDPADALDHHARIAAASLETAVFPTFRPDAALRTEDAGTFNQWVDRLGAAANVAIARLPDFIDALRKRHDAFHAQGCRLSDHGLERCYVEPCTGADATRIFNRVRGGASADAAEAAQFASYLMLVFGHLDAERGWTKQLHLGAFRNVNTRSRRDLGADTGFDAIGDWEQGRALATYFDRLASEHALPRTIVYNLNPSDNYVFATIIGGFQGDEIPGKIQFGSGWWFLDQKEAMEWQLNALSNTGLLTRFIGMVTDSRSFMSFPRHEYFRRVLCNLVGADVDRGELPHDESLVGGMIQAICYDNAAAYLRLPGVTAGAR